MQRTIPTSSMSKTDLPAWVVHKFGGSSVADAACFERVAAIVESERAHEGSPAAAPARLGIVLSACKGVTDRLLELVALAEAQDDAWQARLAPLRERHAAIAEALLTSSAAAEYLREFDEDVKGIAGVL